MISPEYWPEAEDLWEYDLQAIHDSLQDELALDVADRLADEAASLAEKSRVAVESLQRRHVVEEQFARLGPTFNQEAPDGQAPATSQTEGDYQAPQAPQGEGR